MAALKHDLLTEMFGSHNFEWNEQADACEVLMLILRKVHEHFRGNSEHSCVCKLHDAC